MTDTRYGRRHDTSLTYHGASFGGSFHCFYREISGSLRLQDCEIGGLLDLHPAGTQVDGALNLRWSRMNSVDAAAVTTRYDLHAPGIEVDGALYAIGADIGRDLTYESGIINGDVVVNDTDIDRYLNGRDGTVGGDVSADNADIGRDADFRGGTIGGDLDLSDAAIGHTVYLPDEVGGVIDLSGAEIGRVVGELDDHAFRFDDDTVIGDVMVSDR